MVKTIDAETTREMVQEEDVVLIDVLGAESYAQNHLPDAVNVPVSDPDFERMMQARIPSKDDPVIVYCASVTCQASPKAAKKLEQAGYTDVYDFEAGLQGWEDAGFSFEGEGAEEIAARQAGSDEETPKDREPQEGSREERTREKKEREAATEEVDIEDMETRMQTR